MAEADRPTSATPCTTTPWRTVTPPSTARSRATTERRRAAAGAADCRLEDFVAPGRADDRPRRLPARRPGRRTTCWSTTPRRLRAARPPTRAARRSSAELVRALTEGPGVVVLEGAFPDRDVVDRATAAFDAMIAERARRRRRPAGDHFAKPGANDRVWNALEKLAVRDPDAFVDYYANDILALVSTAWLGPGYQVTSQVNVVRPGGQAQDPHRDYHLGFLSNEVVERVPDPRAPALAGADAAGRGRALATCRVESGPTMYLPYSHQYAPGYLAWRLPEFREYFARPLRAAAAGQGRRRVLQPGAVPRRRHQRARPTSSAWPTCCRSPRRSAGRWRPSTGPRCREGGLPGAGAAARHAGADARRARQRGGRRGRGLPVPDQPRPRPARRRADPARPGRDRAAGAGRGLAARRAVEEPSTRTPTRRDDEAIR